MYQIAVSEFIIGMLFCSRRGEANERINKAQKKSN